MNNLELFRRHRGGTGCGNAVEAGQMAFGLIPEVLDSVDVVLVVGEELGVIGGSA